MTDPNRPIRPACEHRMTKLEILIANHVPHVDHRLRRIEKILFGLLTAIGSGFIGLLWYLIRGHIIFR